MAADATVGAHLSAAAAAPRAPAHVHLGQLREAQVEEGVSVHGPPGGVLPQAAARPDVPVPGGRHRRALPHGERGVAV